MAQNWKLWYNAYGHVLSPDHGLHQRIAYCGYQHMEETLSCDRLFCGVKDDLLRDTGGGELAQLVRVWGK